MGTSAHDTTTQSGETAPIELIQRVAEALRDTDAGDAPRITRDDAAHGDAHALPQRSR